MKQVIANIILLVAFLAALMLTNFYQTETVRRAINAVGAAKCSELSDNVTRVVYDDTTLWTPSNSPDTLAPGILVHRYHGGSQFPALVEQNKILIFVSASGTPIASKVDSLNVWKCLNKVADIELTLKHPYECPEF